MSELTSDYTPFLSRLSLLKKKIQNSENFQRFWTKKWTWIPDLSMDAACGIVITLHHDIVHRNLKITLLLSSAQLSNSSVQSITIVPYNQSHPTAQQPSNFRIPRPNFSQTSSRVALIYQSFRSHTIADRL